MLPRKTGYPQDAELVLCTVKDIMNNSVFVTLDEYVDREGIIHISEIAPGRIRSISDYVKRGKKVVCKVLRINQATNNIELSLRRVSVAQRIQKNNALKSEQRAERILQHIAKELNTSPEQLMQTLSQKILLVYQTLFSCFLEAVRDGPKVLENCGIEPQLISKMYPILLTAIKLPEVKNKKLFIMRSPAPDGMNQIKKALMVAEEYAKKKKIKLEMHYLGAPNYTLTVFAPDQKRASQTMDECLALISQHAQKAQVEFALKDSTK